MTARAVTWITAMPEEAWAEDPVAWLVSLTDPSTAAFRALQPTASDIDDGRDRAGMDRRRFLARRALLRALVARRIGVDPTKVVVRYGEAGRPSIEAPGPALFCSVSARGDMAGLALSTRPIGIDLELMQDGAIPWAVLTPREIEHLGSLPEHARMQAFLPIWTLKEACLKALGTGLNRDPATLDVVLADDGPILTDGGRTRRLHPSASRRISLEGRPVIAACFEAEPRNVDYGSSP